MGATLSYNKNLEVLIYEKDKLSLSTRLLDTNGNLKKITEFDKGYLTLILEDKKGKDYEEIIPLDEFLSELGLKRYNKRYFGGINKNNLRIQKG